MKQKLSTSIYSAPQPSKHSEEFLFEELYTNYVGKVYSKCLTMTKDSIAAHDYTQDIFLKVWAKLDTFKNRSAASTWLYSIAHNYCLDRIRLEKRFQSENLTQIVADNLAETDPLESTEAQLHNLEIVLSRLPAEEVYFLRLRYEQNLSIKELATRYQLTESAVKMRLKRTRDKVRDLFDTAVY